MPQTKDDVITNTIVPQNIVNRIRAEREELRRRNARRKDAWIHVAAYDRLAGEYLSDPSRKAIHFKNIETLCKIADKTGVTARDKEMARRAIMLLQDTFHVD